MSGRGPAGGPRSGKIPVFIAGGGPVGLALAVELGTRGVACLLVERGDGAVTVPKMSQLTVRSVEFCRRWGIVDQVKRAGWPAQLPGDFVYLTSLAGREVYRQRVPAYADRGPLAYTPEGPRHCPQIFFDPILLEHARSLPAVTLRHRTQLDSFVQDSEGVRAQITDLDSGRAETVAANYLVGCDGFDGHVRRALGTRYDGSGLLSFSISIFFRSSALPSMHDKGWARFYRFVDETGHWADMIAIDGRELWRLTLLDLDPETDMDSFDAEGSIRRAAGFDVPHEILSVLPWKRRELVADRYRQDRVFIAGDAAHQMSPTGGLGMNTGVADAVDLGWKLAAVLAGWGGPGLLDAYEIERKPVAVASVTASSRVYGETTSIPSGPAIGEDSPEGERLRRQAAEVLLHQSVQEPIGEAIRIGYCYDSSIVCNEPTMSTPGGFNPSARPGMRAPHAWLSPGRSTLDLFGDGFVLLHFDREDLSADRLVRAAANRGVPLRVEDVDDPGIATLYERRLVLVRPDGHVAWRGDAPPADAGLLMDRVRGARMLSPEG